MVAADVSKSTSMPSDAACAKLLRIGAAL